MKYICQIILIPLIPIMLAGCKQTTSTSNSTGVESDTSLFPAEMVDFIPYDKNPVLTGSGGDTWDQLIRERGYILRENGLYHMWYTGYREGPDEERYLGYATSEDGLDWKKYEDNPIFDLDWVEDVCVRKVDSTYYMFAEGTDDIAHMLTSSNRIHWEEHGPLDVRYTNGEPLSEGPYGTPTVWLENDIWYLFYERQDLGIWLATSTDLKTWTNLQDDPVIALGPEPYDQEQVALNQIIKYKGKYFAYYHASEYTDWRKPWTSCVAMSEDLVHWIKYPGNPIMQENKSSPILVHDGSKYRLYTMHPQVCVHFPREPAPLTWNASGNGGIVAAGKPASAQAGIDILRQGGNAVDGAVAVIFCLAVSDYGSFCIGGEVPFMFFNSKTGKVTVFNGMGGAPGDQDAIDWCYSNGIPDQGIRASTVPSAVSTCLTALEMNGTMSIEEVISPTLNLLDAGGEEWHPNLAATLRKLVSTEKETTGTREEKIRKARDRFYKGDLADELNDYYIQSGGFLRKSDLEAHVTLVEDPVSIRYGEFEIYKCNTWTQGPVLLQSLRLLENFDLKTMGASASDYIHVTAEAMKLAYADRDRYYGDPAFVDVPLKQLLSDEYTGIRWPLIDMDHASQTIRPGNPYNLTAVDDAGEYWPGVHGTTNCVVVDKWGNVVAATPSSNGEYGLCESLGIDHNTRLSSLNTQKGHPNSIQAGKRPRITLTPTIVLRHGKPVIAISVAGGDWQDQVSLQLFLDVAEFGMMPEEAITFPRFQTYQVEDSFNPAPDSEKRILNMNVLGMTKPTQSIIKALQAKGHKVETVPEIARPVMVYIDQESGILFAAGEPGFKHCAAIKIP